MLKCYFGHPKSASTFFGKIMLRFGVELGLKHFYKQITLPGSIDQINSNNFDLIISQNSSYSKVSSINQNFKAFHIIRDPRDICVSAYFSYLKTHDTSNWPQLEELRKELQKKDKTEGLKDVIDFNFQFLNNMETWCFEDERILELKFEEYLDNPKKIIFEIMEFLDLVQEKTSPLNFFILNYNRVVFKLFRSTAISIPLKRLSKSRVEKIISQLSFKKLSKNRMKGEENTDSHYRKGVEGDWKNHFKEEHIEYFNSKHPNLLAKLNYN